MVDFYWKFAIALLGGHPYFMNHCLLDRGSRK